MENKKRYLVLQDGTVCEGTAFGADCDSVGELVFTTGVCGFGETLTDPAFFGQIIIQTFPQSGNAGITESDLEGKACARGYVVREWCDTPSNHRSEYDINTFLKANGIPGICGIDTRFLTRKLRDSGPMNAAICDSPPADTSALAAYTVKDAVKNVARTETTVFPAKCTERCNVLLIDYGAKHSLISFFCDRGCRVTAVPADTSAEAVLAYKPDGIVLSDGPGNPAENAEAVSFIKVFAGKMPVFGVGLGHQLFALALGGKTEKLFCGHRGVNQPVLFAEKQRTYITAQNHGYTVCVSDGKASGIPDSKVVFTNANDGTCEGLAYPEKRAFTVQFDPCSCTSPNGENILFDKFIKEMGRD